MATTLPTESQRYREYGLYERSLYTLYAYDGIVHVRVPPGYADHPEDERIYTTPSLTLTNDSSFGDLLLLESFINI